MHYIWFLIYMDLAALFEASSLSLANSYRNSDGNNWNTFCAGMSVSYRITSMQSSGFCDDKCSNSAETGTKVLASLPLCYSSHEERYWTPSRFFQAPHSACCVFIVEHFISLLSNTLIQFKHWTRDDEIQHHQEIDGDRWNREMKCCYRIANDSVQLFTLTVFNSLRHFKVIVRLQFCFYLFSHQVQWRSSWGHYATKGRLMIRKNAKSWLSRRVGNGEEETEVDRS